MWLICLSHSASSMCPSMSVHDPCTQSTLLSLVTHIRQSHYCRSWCSHQCDPDVDWSHKLGRPFFNAFSSRNQHASGRYTHRWSLEYVYLVASWYSLTHRNSLCSLKTPCSHKVGNWSQTIVGTFLRLRWSKNESIGYHGHHSLGSTFDLRTLDRLYARSRRAHWVLFGRGWNACCKQGTSQGLPLINSFI